MKQIFIDHDMCTPQSINFRSKNFSKLITDPRITSKPDIMQPVISAVRSLTKRNDIQQPMFSVSNAENNALLQIQIYIKNMSELKDEFKKFRQNINLKETKISNKLQII